METTELTKIVIAAVIGAFAKELASWFIKGGPAAVVAFKRRVLPWLFAHSKGLIVTLDFVTIFVFAYLAWRVPSEKKVETVGEVRSVALLVSLTMVQALSFVVSFSKYLNELTERLERATSKTKELSQTPGSTAPNGRGSS